MACGIVVPDDVTSEILQMDTKHTHALKLNFFSLHPNMFGVSMVFVARRPKT